MTRKKLTDLESQFLSGEPASPPPEPSHTSLNKIMDSTQSEPTVRFTLDLEKSKHYRLSMLAVKSGKSKADIVRVLIDDLLNKAVSEGLID